VTDGTRAFYDDLAATYDQVYADWPASISRQGDALDTVLSRAGVGRAAAVLDCSCGIGTQSLGLALAGRDVTGTDLSPAAVTRALVEARARGLTVRLAAADMRALPFTDGVFDAVVCADNSLPHLTTPDSLTTALREMNRVLRPGGTVLVTTRDYDALLSERPTSTPPAVSRTPWGRIITFQLWRWHDDGQRYDFEHFQVTAPDAGSPTVRRRTATYWALTRHQLELAFRRAGLITPVWHEPADTGFFQPILTGVSTGAASA
jgi:glycine/sarcosine N-methyltransferase